MKKTTTAATTRNIKVRTALKAGGFAPGNHNRTFIAI